MVSFLLFCRFSCLLSSGTSLQCSHRLLAGYLQCKVKTDALHGALYCIWRGFEAIVMCGGYSDSLVFLFIHSLYTTAEPAPKRSLTDFLNQLLCKLQYLTVHGRGGGLDATPSSGFPDFSREQEELLLQTKFLAVGSSLGHLSMKKFSDRTCHLGSKIRQKEGCWGVGNHPHRLFLPIFLTMKMTFNL